MLHETGYLARNDWWDFPRVLSPFWRLFYNASPGHKVIFGDHQVELTPAHLVLIPDHQLFHCYGRVPVPHLWLHFNAARRPASGQTIPMVLDPGRTEVAILKDLMRLFCAESAERDWSGSSIPAWHCCTLC